MLQTSCVTLLVFHQKEKSDSKKGHSEALSVPSGQFIHSMKETQCSGGRFTFLNDSTHDKPVTFFNPSRQIWISIHWLRTPLWWVLTISRREQHLHLVSLAHGLVICLIDGTHVALLLHKEDAMFGKKLHH